MAKYAFIMSSHRLASSSFLEKFLDRPAFNSGMLLLLSFGGSMGLGFC